MRSFIALAILALPLVTLAQVACEYSCPDKDENGWALATDPTAIGHDSVFSIFECMYVLGANVCRVVVLIVA